MVEKKNDKYVELVNLFLEGFNESRHNANFIRSVPVLEGLIHGAVSKEYWFREVYDEKLRVLHEEGWVYVHQLGKLSPYCVGITVRDLVKKGLNSLAANNISTRPPKYLESLVAQASNVVDLLGQEVAGATAVNDFTTIAASYLYILENHFNKKYDPKTLENIMENFIYTINLPLRAGGNSPFTNITLEFGQPDATLKEEVVIYAGKEVWIKDGKFVFKEISEEETPISFTINEKPLKYKDIPSEYYDRINFAFIKAMARGDGKGKPFTFPLITVNITDDFDFDNPAFNYLLEEMDKWGGIYIENYTSKPFKSKKWKKINPYIKERNSETLRSMCCRLEVSLEELMEITGGNAFRSNAGVGSIGVININLNRILWITQGNYEKTIEILKYIMDVGIENLERKRKWLLEHKDLYPYFFYYNKDLSTYFSSFSTIGLHEGLISAGFSDGIFNEKGRKLAHKIYRWIYEYIKELSKRYKVPVNHEFAPAESAGPNLAKKDIAYSYSISELGKEAERDPFLRMFI